MTRNSRKKLRGNFDENPENDPKEEYKENPIQDKNLEDAETDETLFNRNS